MNYPAFKSKKSALCEEKNFKLSHNLSAEIYLTIKDIVFYRAKRVREERILDQ